MRFWINSISVQPGLHDSRLQSVHFDVAIIDDKNALVRIEQNDTLRHIV